MIGAKRHAYTLLISVLLSWISAAPALAQIGDFARVSDSSSNSLIVDIILTSRFADAYEVAEALTARADKDMNEIIIALAIHREGANDYERELLLRKILQSLSGTTADEGASNAVLNRRAMLLLSEVLHGIASPLTRSAVLELLSYAPDMISTGVILSTGERLHASQLISAGFLTDGEVDEFRWYLECGGRLPTTEFKAQVGRIVAASRQRNVVVLGRSALEELF